MRFEHLRSPIALLLIRLAHRLDWRWIDPSSIASVRDWKLFDWEHDVDEDRKLEVARTTIDESCRDLQAIYLSLWWITQHYERHEKNPVKHLRHFFKGLFRKPSDVRHDAYQGRAYLE